MNKEYCKCFFKMQDFIGEGKILGFHLISSEDGCGGYITDNMLKAYNPKHPLLKKNKEKGDGK